MKKDKKILIVISIIAILICTICLPVSAFATGGATITMTEAWFTNWGSNSALTYGEITERDDGYFWHTNLDSNLSTGTVYGDVQIFSFSATNNYGTLVVKYRNSFGTEYNTAYNRLYDYDTGSNLGATVTISDGIITLTYTGYVPSSIRLATYFISTNGSSSSLTSFSFTPIDKATQDIIDNQNSNTQAEIEADKENTQAIIDNQNQLAEQEKQDVTDSGNDSVDSATEAIPNYDFFEAIGVFVDSLGSTDTECVIDIPRIYIPKVAMIPETTLYNGGAFDFATVIDMIPDKILLLVQYILTVSLILYGCKEFYDLIFKSVDGVSKIGDDT